MNESSFLSVDWGTTNLRIRWVQLPDFSVLKSRFSDLGVKNVFERFQTSGLDDRVSFFLQFLLREIQAMEVTLPDACQVIISGMASSSIGMLELPYTSLPFYANGKELKVEKWLSDGFPFPVSLISGVKSADDVMRGEETQLIGLFQGLNPSGNSLFILPGTHSKHIFLENDKVTSFNTYMTGEMFDILSKNSVLNKAIEKGSWDESAKSAFQYGVHVAIEKESVLNALFMVRTNVLFEKMGPRDNYFFLSGLLIGNECKYLMAKNLEQIYIFTSGILFYLYLEAANSLGISVKSNLLSEEIFDQALLKGQWYINQLNEE